MALLVLLYLAVCGGGLSLRAQGQRFDDLFRDAYELYQAKLYAAAETAFGVALSEAGVKENPRRATAAYHMAVCALRLGRKDGEYRMLRFLEEYAESPYAAQGIFELGLLRFRAGDWQGTIDMLERVDARALDREEASERNFKLGYAYFSLKRSEEAATLFAQVKDTKTYYSAYATYFYAHMAYEQGNYETALEEFDRIAEDASFSAIIPYYVAQMYYKRGEYGKVAKYVPAALEGAAESRRPELLRLLGDSQYRLGEDSASLSTWKQYLATTGAVTREEHYIVGMLNYRLQRYGEAVQHLEKVATEDDKYAQNAYYYLGDCYMRQGDKSRARAAFEMASRSSHDSVLREDALFTFAKLTYELRESPLSDAVDAFTRYLDEYPDSPRASEVYNYLGLAYASTKNYQKTLDVLQRISRPDALTQQAIQRAAYFRGVELYQNLKYAEADSLFAVSLSVGAYVPELRASALYWRGEALFRLQKYALAAKFYRDYRGSARAFTQKEYARAAYNLGYCQFKIKNYKEAGEWFEMYASRESGGEPVDMRTDAYCRLGDCRYVERAYWPAIEAYGKAVDLGGVGADYALFQEGFAYGLVERPERKVRLLRRFEKEFASSSYRPEAFYELGLTLQSEDSLASASRCYERVVREYPGSSKASSALVQLGLVAYAQAENEKAIGYFKRVMKDYPRTPQAEEALLALERVYQSEGRIKDFFSYAESLGLAQQYSRAERDSIVYTGAVELYFRGLFPRAAKALREYVDEYPNGSYSLPAKFYLGEALCAQGDTLAALPYLRDVVGVQAHRWRERALELLGEAYESHHDWQQALETYSELEIVASSVELLTKARAGSLRMAVKLGKNGVIVESATRLLSTEKLPPELALYANYHLGGALRMEGRLDEAYAAYSRLGANTGSAVGAEARYQMAWIRYAQRNWDDVSKEVTAFAHQNTPHQYWLGKAFILLAKAYAEKGDFFQAKATLQSVVDRYSVPNDGVMDEARRELEQLVRTEKARQREKRGDTIQFEFQK